MQFRDVVGAKTKARQPLALRREHGANALRRLAVAIGAINSSVTLSSVNNTRSAPSPLLRQAGVRPNSD